MRGRVKDQISNMSFTYVFQMHVDPVVINKTLCVDTIGIHKIYLNIYELTLLLLLCIF